MRLAGYCRVSTQEQARHGISIDDQVNAVRQFAAEHGDDIAVYIDNGISARKKYTKRPALLQLLTDCQLGKIDMIVFTKLDRWFRNVGNYYEVQSILDDCNVTWKAIREDYETVTASGRLKVNIMLSVAQDEADRTSERIKAVNQYRRESGQLVCGLLPIGYKRADGQIVKDPDTEAAVADMFQLFLDGYSIRQICIIIRERHGVERFSSSVSKTLRNDFYTGVRDGITFPAYITESEHETIMRRMAEHHRVTNCGVYLFAGLTFCAGCGGAVTWTHTDYPTGCCNRHRNKKMCDDYASLSQRKVERYLLDNLDSLIEDASEQSKEAPKTKKEPAKETIEGRLDRLKELFEMGDIGRSEYIEKRDALKAQLEKMSAPPTPIKLDVGWREAYDSLPPEGKKAFWNRTIKRIDIHRNTVVQVEFCRLSDHVRTQMIRKATHHQLSVENNGKASHSPTTRKPE